LSAEGSYLHEFVGQQLRIINVMAVPSYSHKEPGVFWFPPDRLHLNRTFGQVLYEQRYLKYPERKGWWEVHDLRLDLELAYDCNVRQRNFQDMVGSGMDRQFAREFPGGLGVGDVHLEGGAMARVEEVRRFGERRQGQ